MTEEAPVDAGQVAEAAAPVESGQAPAEQKAWYSEASEDVQGYIQNKGWDDPMKAVNSYQELEKFQGASPDKLIKLPKDGEPMDEVYNKLGRPETADKYTWEAPEGVQTDDGFLNAIKETAHSKGVSQEAFESLATTYAEYQAQAMQQHEEAEMQKQEAELTKLKSELGPAYDERVEMGRRFVSRNLPSDMDKAQTLDAIEGAIGTAAMIKLFSNAGEKSGVVEDRLPSSDGERPFGYTPQQAAADKKELMQSIAADPQRLALYNSGKGNDYDKLKKLNTIVAG